MSACGWKLLKVQPGVPAGTMGKKLEFDMWRFPASNKDAVPTGFRGFSYTESFMRKCSDFFEEITSPDAEQLKARGYEWTGDMRLPHKGEIYIVDNDLVKYHFLVAREEGEPCAIRFIVRPIQPPLKELCRARRPRGRCTCGQEKGHTGRHVCVVNHKHTWPQVPVVPVEEKKEPECCNATSDHIYGPGGEKCLCSLDKGHEGDHICSFNHEHTWPQVPVEEKKEPEKRYLDCELRPGNDGLEFTIEKPGQLPMRADAAMAPNRSDFLGYFIELSIGHRVQMPSLWGCVCKEKEVVCPTCSCGQSRGEWKHATWARIRI